MTDGIIGATTVSDAVNDSIEKKEPTRDIRQKDLIPPDRLEMIEAHVIGCGAIGRQVACMLSAMGVPTINLIDHDAIEVVNLGPQAWSTEYLGQYKVLAVAENLQMINSDTDVKTHLSRWRTSMLSNKSNFRWDSGGVAVFCCVDSIETRKHIWLGNKADLNFWVDGRMAGEVLRVITAVDDTSFMNYPSTLFSEDEAFTGACTTQSTVYSASLAAGLMVSQFAKWLRNAPIDNDLTFSIGSGELAPTITDPLIP
jgi:hypothetical protein